MHISRTPVRLSAIAFNFGGNPISAPLNLRMDASRSVPVPEWTEGSSSPVAYTAAAIRSRVVQIRAQFCREHGAPRTFWIQARQTSGVLGAIEPFRLDFTLWPTPERAECQSVMIPLDPAHLHGIGAHDQHWDWEWRDDPSGEWRELRETHHRVFVVLDDPGSPWDAHSGNPALWPWVSALEKSCDWAAGATNPITAAGKITEAFLSLGADRMFRYDPLDTYSSFTLDTPSPTDNGFDLTRVLSTLNNDPNGIHKVNCTDAACCISVLSNVLGCELRQTRLQQLDGADPHIFTNRLLPLAATELAGPIAFRYHEVAWMGEPNSNGKIWDGCFLLLEHGGGKVEPSIGVRFGRPGSEDYLDRFARPVSRPNLRAQILCNRPIVPALAPSNPNLPVPDDPADTFNPAGPPGLSLFAWGFLLEGNEFADFEPSLIDIVRIPSGRLQIDSCWNPSGTVDRTVRIEVRVEHTLADAIKVTRQRKSGANAIASEPEPSQPARVAVSQIANLAYSIRCVGREDIPDVTPLESALQDILLRTEPDGLPKLPVRIPQPAFRTDIPLRLPAPITVKRWYKLLSTTGSFFSSAGKLYYSPGKGTEHRVHIYAMEMGKAVAYADLTFTMPPGS